MSEINYFFPLICVFVPLWLIVFDFICVYLRSSAVSLSERQSEPFRDADFVDNIADTVLLRPSV
jgi:hypothetical protein